MAFELAGKTRSSVRRIVVSGFAGSGKSTFSVSASKFAGATLPLDKPADAADVLLVQGDAEGVYGPIDSGLTPRILDLSNLTRWAEYSQLLANAIVEVSKSTEIEIVVIDAALPAKLIVESVAPKSIADWGQVAAQGRIFFNVFNALPGKTVILNTQVKPNATAVESDQARQASEAKSIGGERATFTVDMPKGISGLWIENASLMFAREVKRVKDAKSGAVTRKFLTHTSASARLETKSRFHSKLPETLVGSPTLNKVLLDCYGPEIK